jgi:hypothetical protein
MEWELEWLNSHVVVRELPQHLHGIMDQVEWAFCSHFGVKSEDIKVSRCPPADFLITFTHQHHWEAVVAARGFPHNNLVFRIRPWQLVTLGDRHDLFFHVRLCMEGIPPHTWNESIAKHLVT